MDLLALEELLERLADVDVLCAEIVTMRVFGGLSMEEIAAVTDVSVRTVYTRWRFARGWLAEQLAT